MPVLGKDILNSTYFSLLNGMVILVSHIGIAPKKTIETVGLFVKLNPKIVWVINIVPNGMPDVKSPGQG